MRVKIRIDTGKDAQEIAKIASGVKGNVTISDSSGFIVNAKSILGALYAMEFSELWLSSDEDIYSQIEPYVILESYPQK